MQSYCAYCQSIMPFLAFFIIFILITSVCTAGDCICFWYGLALMFSKCWQVQRASHSHRPWAASQRLAQAYGISCKHTDRFRGCQRRFFIWYSWIFQCHALPIKILMTSSTINSLHTACVNSYISMQKSRTTLSCNILPVIWITNQKRKKKYINCHKFF